MEQLSEKKKPKKKKKKLAASEGFRNDFLLNCSNYLLHQIMLFIFLNYLVKDTATNSVENNSNKSSQEIVDGKNTIPSLEDNKEGKIIVWLKK